MNLVPSHESGYVLKNEKGARVAIIMGTEIYTLVPESGEGIAELFNGASALALVPNTLSKQSKES